MENNYWDFHLNENEIVLDWFEQIIKEIRSLREQNKSLNEERCNLYREIEKIRDFLKDNNIMEYGYTNKDWDMIYPKTIFRYKDKQIII